MSRKFSQRFYLQGTISATTGAVLPAEAAGNGTPADVMGMARLGLQVNMATLGSGSASASASASGSASSSR